MYVWLNGEFIGYSEDSFTPSEFELTPYIREKDNKLAVAVFKRSSASWLEDQDFGDSPAFSVTYSFMRHRLPMFVI